jgi:phosphoribosyl 1,2-cyclic phosphate phosphodiesterase
MINDTIKVTFNGTGTSQGVPVIGCHCNVCKSKNKKNNRLRSSISIETKGTSLVIDAGPDFRQQMLRANIDKLDAIIFTHEHKDHVAGLDDVRAYNFLSKKPVNIYCNDNVFKALKREYHYIFDPAFQYPGIPKIIRNKIKKDTIFNIKNVKIEPIEVLHYKLPVLGFRIKDFCYITDASFISKDEKKKLKNLKVLVLNALRKEKHISHFNLEEALELINELKPEKAYLTHISHLMGEHKEVSNRLPKNVEIAYDTLSITIK